MAIFPLDGKTEVRYFVGMHKETAVLFFGTQQKLADALGCAQGTVSGWGDVVPLGRAFVLEKITNGALKVDLDLYPEAKPLRDQGRAAA
jgi:DNA-binding transcriptional regulator YdaS (Cro superfamily)